MGSISNITEDGFGPAAFHSFPSTLKIDGLSGDYGPNFFGYAVNSATYITYDKELGWLAFGGNVKKSGEWINVEITTGPKSRVYIAPAGVWLTLDAGTFNRVSYNEKSGQISVLLDQSDAYTPKAYLHVQQPSANKRGNKYKLTGNVSLERDAYVITLSKENRKIEIQNK